MHQEETIDKTRRQDRFQKHVCSTSLHRAPQLYRKCYKSRHGTKDENILIVARDSPEEVGVDLNSGTIVDLSGMQVQYNETREWPNAMSGKSDVYIGVRIQITILRIQS